MLVDGFSRAVLLRSSSIARHQPLVTNHQPLATSKAVNDLSPSLGAECRKEDHIDLFFNEPAGAVGLAHREWWHLALDGGTCSSASQLNARPHEVAERHVPVGGERQHRTAGVVGSQVHDLREEVDGLTYGLPARGQTLGVTPIDPKPVESLFRPAAFSMNRR